MTPDMAQPMMRQEAPYPTFLKALVDKLRYRRWDDNDGRTYEGAMDAYHPEQPRPVYFYFPVPAATYDERSWRRWLLDRILDVEQHEACEFFQIGDDRPYAPSHGPGNDPYTIRELSTDLDKRTSFRGAVKAA